MRKLLKYLKCVIFHGDIYAWGSLKPWNGHGEWHCTKCGREWTTWDKEIKDRWDEHGR